MNVTRMVLGRATRGSARRRSPRLINRWWTGKHKCVLAAAIVAAFGAGSAPRTDAGPSAWHVGPIPSVQAICHAGDTLWVGTSAGLFRVDVRTAAEIDRIAAGPMLPSPSVRAIVARGDSVVVATDGGLSIFAGGTVEVFTPRAPRSLGAIPLARLSCLAVGRGGELLIGSRGFGAGVVGADSVYAVTERDSLLDDAVLAISDRRPAGPRYFAWLAGLCARLEDSTFAWYQAGAGLPRGEARRLAIGVDGSVYVLVSRKGIYRFDGSRGVAIDAPAEVPLADALDISAGVDGALWATGDGWIAVRRGRSWKQVPLAAADAAAQWLTVVADGAGAFAGSGDGVVLAIDRGSALRLALADGLPSGRVESIAPDGNGNAWLVNGGRVVAANATPRRYRVEDGPTDARAVAVSAKGAVVTAGRWSVHRRAPSGWIDLEPDVIETDPAFTGAAIDDDGRTWIGMRSGALYRYDGEIWLRMARGSGSRGGHGVVGVQATGGAVWAMSGAVPVQCVGGALEAFPGMDSTESAVDLKRSPAGDWVVVTPTRLYRLDRVARRWERVGAEALAVDRVDVPPGDAARPAAPLSAIAFDARGHVYLGTTDGIGLVSRAGVRWMHADEGLEGSRVTSLAADDTFLWVGFAADGFSVFRLDDLW
jgi:ligand-binding sensor domain-containing protein